MTRDSSGPNSSENEEPLSATAMFLRSMDEPSAAPRQDAGWGAGSVPPAQAQVPLQQPANAGPGEFTRMFQLPHQGAPVTPAAQPAGANAGPGGFTQIFYTGPGSPEAKTLVEPPPYVPQPAAQPGSGSRKGFSTPGVSDSASGEGSATQIFKPLPPRAAPPVMPPQPGPLHASAHEPMLPNPAYVPEPAWKAQPQNQPASGQSVTQLISSLGAQENSAGKHTADPVPYSAAPVPAYTPTPQQEPHAAPEAGSVTRLIQQLAQRPAEPAPAPFASAVPTAPAGSGPGEFTRMISLASAQGAPQAVTPHTPAPAQPMPQFPAMPQAVMPQMPHLQAGAPAAPPPHMQMPQMQMPQMQIPRPPAMPPTPQVAPPKGKLEGMVPVLLIVNTFLLVLILVVVLFALKAH